MNNICCLNAKLQIKCTAVREHIYKIALTLKKELQIKEQSETKPVNVAIEMSANRRTGFGHGVKQNVGDKKRMGIGVQGRVSACLLQRHRETIRGNMCRQAARGKPFFALALVSSSSWWCLLCIRYGLIKLICRYVFVRTCAYRRKPKSLFLTEHLSVSSRLHFKVFSLFEIIYSFARYRIHSAGGL